MEITAKKQTIIPGELWNEFFRVKSTVWVQLTYGERGDLIRLEDYIEPSYYQSWDEDNIFVYSGGGLLTDRPFQSKYPDEIDAYKRVTELERILFNEIHYNSYSEKVRTIHEYNHVMGLINVHVPFLSEKKEELFLKRKENCTEKELDMIGLTTEFEDCLTWFCKVWEFKFAQSKVC